MPCRRPHRKSRLGCKNCKAKRTKCDEVHPVCGNCVKYNLRCDFVLPSRSKSPTSSSLPPVKIPQLNRPVNHLTPPLSDGRSPSHDSGSLVPASSSQGSPGDTSTLIKTEVWTMEPGSLEGMTMNTPQDRMLELKLMHHFTTMVSNTLFRLLGNRHFQQAYTRDAFSRWVTDLAMSHPGLMDGLLGFSAFNLRQLQGSDDKELSLASHKYMTAAITAHSQQLNEGINDQTAEILFAGSALIAFCAISSHEYLSPDNNADIPLHWFRPWQGVRSVAKASWDFIHTEEIVILLNSERMTFWEEAGLAKMRNPVFDFLLADLDREATDLESLEAYDCSVYYLSLVLDNPDLDYCFKFTAKVPLKFVKMLEEKDARALTIVGYFFMVLKISEQVWWLPRSTGREFRSLMKLLPEEWKPRMAWAVSVFDSYED
ncbi:uncharacterized protein PAC_02085 [Phialocephala subalpina]|uniref:Zn(2)-C6 fungal-type domain-containing protein n=1 Tax=Phialocephala subalpina TaxID=576137 RepID=A0A1L7WHF5_9HELO|nr:uncharacterized protein PAC_02085 [Phialocephala subalpina]